MLLHVISCPDFSTFAPLHPATPTPSGNPLTIVQVHGYANKLFGYSISYIVFYTPMAIL